MFSRSSSSAERPLAIGRVAGFRGTSGEITVRVASGQATRWRTVTRVFVGDGAEGGARRLFEVAGARCYRDRLVLKLRGIDDPSGAEALKGSTVLVPPEQVPRLGKDEHYVGRLVGLRVVLVPTGEALGTVTDVASTGGTDVLVVEEADGHELLVPMAREIVVEIEEREGRIAVRLPPGLRSLNRARNGS